MRVAECSEKGEKAVRYAVRKVERALLNYALVFRMLIQFTNSFNVSVSGRICMFTISNSFEVCASVLGFGGFLNFVQNFEFNFQGENFFLFL